MGWFDDLAKRSAQRASSAEPGSGLSRREVLARGAVVAGVAWTAPMLMATQAAAQGLSACPTGQLCGDAGNQICCPNSTDTCNIIDGTPTCTPVGEAGGSCGNMGQGVCNQPYKCNGNTNQCNNCAEPNICGGEGAECCAESECFTEGGLTCVQQTGGDGVQATGFCRRPCTTDANCNTGQVCNGGFCAEDCSTDSDCTGAAICRDSVCTYQVDGGVTCP